jgi:hypothetical protein
MKSVFVFFAILALSAAAAPSYWFSGSTSTNASFSNPSPTANYVDTLTGACATGATATGYQKFTINATEDSFYYITALFEKAGIIGGQIQVYTGAFVSTTPCVGIRSLALASRGGPHLAILEWFPQGIYTVVITARDPTSNGIFAIHADAAKFNGVTNSASPVWNRPYGGYDTCSTSSYYVGYTSWTFSVPTTGYYDFFLFTYNSTITNYFVAALYNQTVTFAGTGNYSNPVSGCIAGYVESWDEETTYSGISQTGFSAGTLLNQWLVANYTYTVVAGSYNEFYYYNLGLWWRPTVVGKLGDTVNYLQPDITAYGNQINPCTPDDSPRPWQAQVFRAAYATIVLDNGVSPSGNGIGDTAGCLFTGSNAGTPYTVPPESCPAGFLQCGDTYDGGSVSQLGLTLGANYTWVQSCFGSCSASLNYALFLYGGVQLGPSPVSTTGSETSGSAAVLASVALTAAALLF